ncbi:MAG: leucine-rich repeat protein [Clostridia bacterium]|nr:leucine-rich repeat protein [Clostridia bacterium]
MKKKLLFILFATLLTFVFALCVSAATTVTPSADELGACVIKGEVVDVPVTQGMSYTVLDEEAKTVALSSRGSTDSFDGAVVIPSTIKIDGVDYTVTVTNPSVFASTSITKAYVPDTVVEMKGETSGNDNGTFANCSYLSEVYIGTGIKILGRFIFTSIGKSSPVKVFNVAGKVQELGEYCFNAANFADDCQITFDSSDMRIIGPRVFDNGSKSLKRIDSHKLESIGERGFASSKSLEYILIPEYCTVGLYAFNGTDNLQTAIILCGEDEIKEIPKEMFSSGTSGYKTNIYISGRVVATEWAVLPGRAFNIYMDSYENAKYFADSIMKYQHNRISNGTWYFCTPYNGSYCFSANSSFTLTPKADVTEPPHVAIYNVGVETKATCNQYAGIGDICEVCGAYFNLTQTGNEYDENAHNYVLNSHTDPQCIETGVDVYECTYCSAIKNVEIPALGHDYDKETILPTCSRIGYTNNVCKRCDYSIITDKVDTIPHSYLGENLVVDGINVSYDTICKYCGALGDHTETTLINKCYIEGYGIFDATLEYLSISEDGTVTPSNATFDNAEIYFPSYVEIGGSIVQVSTISGFKDKSIKSIYIPDTVTRIASNSFERVYNLKNIVVGKGVSELESSVFNMNNQNVYLDEFIFTGTIKKLQARSLARVCASSSDIPYQFNTRLTYVGAYVSTSGRDGGNILREVYITNECDLSEKFGFNGSNGLKRAYIEGGATAETAKEITQELFSGDANGLEIVVKGYIKSTGQAVLPTSGALVFFKTLDQAKVFAASVNAQDYNERGTKSGWYICDEYSESETRRFIIDNYTSDPETLTFKRQDSNYFYHVGEITVEGATCTQGGTETGSCFLCGTVLASSTSEPLPHNYDGGVFTSVPSCLELGTVKYTCLDCGDEIYVTTGYDLSGHVLDVILDVVFKNGYNKNGTYVKECSLCHEVIEEQEPTFPFLFTCLGYSTAEFANGGISIGYKVDKDAILEYEKITGIKVSYGLFVGTKNALGTKDVIGEDGKAVAGAITVGFDGSVYSYMYIKMVGFDTEESKAVEFAIGAYAVTTENEQKKYSYLQHGTPLEGDKYAFIKYNDFVKINN